MRAPLIFRWSILLTLTALTLSCTASSASASEPDPLTREAASLFKEGKLQQSIDTEEKAIQQQPQSWLPHATLSYLHWQSGNAPDAIAEGQKAVRYAPHNSVALVNLGNVYQQLGDSADAIPLYEEARKVDPENWLPWICLAQCYVGTDKQVEAIDVLSNMSSHSSASFPWQYQLGETYLTIDKPGLAVEPLDKAVKCATMPQQKSAGLADLLVALVRDNQLERARSMMQQSINTAHPKSTEPYICAASALLSAQDPQSGKELLQVACQNLDSIKDAEGFARLGRIFEEKADATIRNDTISHAWLDNADAAFNQAIGLDSRSAKHHIARAAILERLLRIGEALQELAQAAAVDKTDPVGSFLASRVSQEGAHATPEQTRLRDVMAVSFTVSGLTCGCQATRIDGALQLIPGIATVNFSRIKPYSGTVFVDKSVTTVDKLFARCKELAFPADATLKVTPPELKFEMGAEQVVPSIDEAEKILRYVQCANVLSFPRHFDSIQPQMPVPLVAEKTGSAI